MSHRTKSRSKTVNSLSLQDYDLSGLDFLITLTRRVRHVKHPDLVRRCLTVSDPGALFLLTLDGFELGVMFAPPSDPTKKVVRGAWSNRGTKFPLGVFGCAEEADDVGRRFTSGVEFDDRYNPVMTV